MHVYDYIVNNEELNNYLIGLCKKTVKKGNKDFLLTKRMIVNEMLKHTENQTTDMGIEFSRLSMNYAVNKFLFTNNL